jgi:hypothetical protein
VPAFCADHQPRLDPLRQTAADIPIPHHPDLPQQPAHDLDHTTEPFTSGWTGDHFDLDYVVMVMAQHSS